MSTLLIDAGNTRIKWAQLRGARLGAVRAVAWQPQSIERIARQIIGPKSSGQRVLVGSVAGSTVDAALRRAASQAGAPKPIFVHSVRREAGVTSAYRVPSRLGVDRWLALIGARSLWPRQALCIINLGTAITVDVLNAQGRHRGGWIIPGPRLMVESLLTNTALIRQRARAGRVAKRAATARWACDSRAAIEIGAVQASHAIVTHARRSAERHFQQPVRLVLSGGGASPAVASDIAGSVRSDHVPHLVLVGLAVLAGQSAD